MASIRIDDLVDKRCWKIVFETCLIKIMEIYADADSTLFFGNRDGVGDLTSILDRENESGLS